MHQRLVRVINPQGLHARPADLIVRCAGQFQSEIQVAKGAERVDCRSILSLLTLGANEGTELLITAQGDDAEDAIAAVAALFEIGFNELESSDTPAIPAAVPDTSP